VKRPEQWPIHKAIGVTVRCRSGQSFRFSCEQLTVQASADGRLVGYQWANAKGAPLYIDPGAIESVVTSPVWRWRGWHKAPVMNPIVDAEANAAVGEPINLEGSDGGPLPRKDLH
jgi:hypothetical protein